MSQKTNVVCSETAKRKVIPRGKGKSISSSTKALKPPINAFSPKTKKHEDSEIINIETPAIIKSTM
jgi:hypothetical protein